MPDFATARFNMVENQIRPNRVTDARVLEAMADVPRERFVPKKLQDAAYIDEDLAIADGRFLMEPAVFARLVQAAAITPDDLVLDVGCGTGYSTAVLARLAAYDAIVLGGSVDEAPRALTDQLAEGGRLVAVVTGGSAVGRGVVVLRLHGALSRRVLFDAAVPPLPEFRVERGFVF